MAFQYRDFYIFAVMKLYIIILYFIINVSDVLRCIPTTEAACTYNIFCTILLKQCDVVADIGSVYYYNVADIGGVWTFKKVLI